MELDALKALMRDNGIVGCGGAGFPSYAKADARADTLILNCAECEPLLRLHRQLLKVYTHEILSTLDLIAKTVGAKQVFIGIKGSYKRTTAAVEAELPSFENMKLCRLPEVYPAGDEVVLTYQATGRVVPPGAIPLAVGVTVFNVETVYNVYRALQGKPVTHKYVTVTGEVTSPVTVYAPLGKPIDELLSLAGGVTTDDPVYCLGGPMMGRLGSLSDVVTKTTNAVLVLPRSLPLVQRKLGNTAIDMKRAMAACCQCNYCTLLCPRHLLGHPIDPSSFMLHASNGITNDVTPYVNASFCSGCGLCELYSCGQGMSPRTLLSACKSGLRKAGVKPPKDVPLRPVDPARPDRMIPLSRLRSRLGLDKYNRSAPILEDPVPVETLFIPLSQHIGAPAVAAVAAGDTVHAGDVIARAAEDALSVPIHAPVDGTVTAVDEKQITVKP